MPSWSPPPLLLSLGCLLRIRVGFYAIASPNAAIALATTIPTLEKVKCVDAALALSSSPPSSSEVFPFPSVVGAAVGAAVGALDGVISWSVRSLSKSKNRGRAIGSASAVWALSVSSRTLLPTCSWITSAVVTRSAAAGEKGVMLLLLSTAMLSRRAERREKSMVSTFVDVVSVGGAGTVDRKALLRCDVVRVVPSAVVPRAGALRKNMKRKIMEKSETVEMDDTPQFHWSERHRARSKNRFRVYSGHVWP